MRRGALALQIPLEWKLSVQGANEVKTKLQEIQQAFDRGEISASEYGKQLRAVNRDARSFVGTTTLQKNIFLATHPVFNQISRSLSTLSSVSRGFLAISNAINLAFIARRGLSSEQLEIQRDLNTAFRELATATDPIRIAELNEEINILQARLKELGDQEIIGKITDIGIGLSTVAIIAKSVVDIIAKIRPGMLTGLGALFGGAGVAGLGAVTAGFGAIAFAVALAAEEMFKWLTGLDDLTEWRAKNVQLLTEFFTLQIPLALGKAAEFLTNFFLVDLPSWGKTGFTTLGNIIISILNGVLNGFENWLNLVRKAINKLISAANKLPGINIQKISKVTIPSIPFIAAATGFEGEVTKPTLFLAGEAGNETVSIRPNGRNGGGQITIIQNIAGSILAERDVERIAQQGLKKRLKSHGFTGV